MWETGLRLSNPSIAKKALADIMTTLDASLASLLEKRKHQGRFRSLKKYDTSPSSPLVDFVSG